MLHRYLTYPNYTWVPGYVLADDVLNISMFMVSEGYLAAGYNYMNLDDAIVWGRNVRSPGGQGAATPSVVRSWAAAGAGTAHRTHASLIPPLQATGYLVPDAQAFPFGFKNYTSQVSALGFKPGVYTDRGGNLAHTAGRGNAVMARNACAGGAFTLMRV